eukprot:Gb_05528 [translate_table: standard]
MATVMKISNSFCAEGCPWIKASLRGKENQCALLRVKLDMYHSGITMATIEDAKQVRDRVHLQVIFDGIRRRDRYGRHLKYPLEQLPATKSPVDPEELGEEYRKFGSTDRLIYSEASWPWMKNE